MAWYVNETPEYASLKHSAFGEIHRRPCLVPQGSTVELVAVVGGLGIERGPQRRLFVRVRGGGACQGAELILSEDHLSDVRDTLEPTFQAPK